MSIPTKGRVRFAVSLGMLPDLFGSRNLATYDSIDLREGMTVSELLAQVRALVDRNPEATIHCDLTDLPYVDWCAGCNAWHPAGQHTLKVSTLSAK